MNKRKSEKIGTIRIVKVAVGHKANTHQVHDNRPKRKRTRNAQLRSAMKDQ